MVDINVVYWQKEHGKAKPTKHDHVCFSGLKNKTELVKYKCVTKTTKEVSEFYIKFLRKILDPKKFDYTFSENDVIFTTYTSEFTRPKALLYLTAQRYINETPEFVNELYKSKDKSVEELFEEFQRLHFKAAKRELELAYNNLGGHCLMYNYSWSYQEEKDFQAITLKEFKKKLKKELSTVQSYFIPEKK